MIKRRRRSLISKSWKYFKKNKIRSIDVQMSQANESQATDKTNQIKYQNLRNKQSIMRQNIQKGKEEKPTKDMTAKKT
jgi:hypothetical protein